MHDCESFESSNLKREYTYMVAGINVSELAVDVEILTKDVADGF